MNKRVVSGILLVLILASLLININFVSAQDFSENIKAVQKEFSGIVAPILSFLFNLGHKDAQGNWVPLETTEITQGIMSFIFAFIILLVFLLPIVKKVTFFSDNRGLGYFAIVIFAILGVRGLAQLGVTEIIFMPYTAVALAIINGAIIVGWFVIVNLGFDDIRLSFLRRVLWILFGISFIGVYASRFDEIIPLLHYIYWATAIVAFLLALVDGTLQGVIMKIRADNIKNVNRLKEIAQLKKELEEVNQMYNGTPRIIDRTTYNTMKGDLQIRIREAMKRK